MFSGAVDEGLSPQEFIDKMRKCQPFPNHTTHTTKAERRAEKQFFRTNPFPSFLFWEYLSYHTTLTTKLSAEPRFVFVCGRSGRNVLGRGRRRPFSSRVHRQDA